MKASDLPRLADPFPPSDIEWVTEWDGADNSQVEAVEGGLSGATKRAAVQVPSYPPQA